jgi:hypothetical protein
MISLFSAISLGQVVAEGTDVGDQVVRTLLEAHQHAGFVVSGRALHQERQREQRLAAAGGAGDQRRPARRQPPEGDFVQPGDPALGLAQGFGRRLRMDRHRTQPWRHAQSLAIQEQARASQTNRKSRRITESNPP